MRWAITPRGAGKPVGFRVINTDDDLVSGEFASTTDPVGKVLADDSTSLRAPTAGEVLAAARLARWEYIKTRRQAALEGGVDWNGHRWDTEEDDVNRVSRTLTSWQRALSLPPEQQAMLPAPVPTAVSWTTADNEEVLLSVAELAMLDAAISLHTGVVFDTAKPLRAAINAAQTLEAINAVDWPA